MIEDKTKCDHEQAMFLDHWKGLNMVMKCQRCGKYVYDYQIKGDRKDG